MVIHMRGSISAWVVKNVSKGIRVYWLFILIRLSIGDRWLMILFSVLMKRKTELCNIEGTVVIASLEL